ncbi:MAG: aminomethyltransferase family protein [Candidatus Promineifilaceae bacterium]
MPIPSPFHSRTSAACESQEWRDWAGYLAAACYEPSHEREYYAIRNAAGLIDVSPLFKYDVVGPDALRLVNRVMTRDLARCSVGQIMYSPWCDEAGKLLDDGTVWRLGTVHFRVTAAEPNLLWLADCGVGLTAEVRDVSAELAALAIQGPASRAILGRVAPDADLAGLKYYRLTEGTLADVPLTVTRTGYTGDLGYELWLAPQDAGRVWDCLLDAGRAYGLLPAGMLALDIARIEAGLIMQEVDYLSARKALSGLRTSSPYEAGLAWAVALDKGPFIGRRALRAERAAGSAWALVGLEIDWPQLERHFERFDLPPQVAGRAARQTTPLYNAHGRQVGYATSSAFSPILKKYIALATVESGYARPGTQLQIELSVEYTRPRSLATVVKTPFYEPAWKRA